MLPATAPRSRKQDEVLVILTLVKEARRCKEEWRHLGEQVTGGRSKR